MPSPVSRIPLRGLPSWLLLMGALTAIGPLSIDMYLPAFPAIAEALAVERGAVQQTLATFFIGLAAGQLVYGPVSDRFGRKPPLYVGLALFVAASLACAGAQSIETLTTCRFLQGLGGSVGPVIARAVVRDRCEARDAARALSLLMLVMGLAPVLAPMFGGLLLTWFGWRAVFLALVLFASLSLLAVHCFMSESHRPVDPPPLRPARVLRDYAGLFADRVFMAYAICGALIQAMIFAYIAAAPFVLIELYGIAPTHFGWVFGLNAMGLIAASQINARFLLRVSPETVLRRGVWLPLTVSVLAMLAQALGWLTLPVLLTVLFLLLSSYGFVVPNTTALAMARQGGRAGTASALLGALQFGSGTVVATAMSYWQELSARPMLAVMAACTVASWLTFQLGRTANPPVR